MTISPSPPGRESSLQYISVTKLGLSEVYAHWYVIVMWMVFVRYLLKKANTGEVWSMTRVQPIPVGSLTSSVTTLMGSPQAEDPFCALPVKARAAGAHGQLVLRRIDDGEGGRDGIVHAERVDPVREGSRW
jgi:hypothetical protein